MKPRAGKSHLSSTSQSVVWLTPPHIIAALGRFDLDPCAAPPPRPFFTADRVIALPEDGLAQPWSGRIWLNPPFGTEPLKAWMGRMAAHDHGTALVPAATETAYWWKFIWPRASALLFLGKGRPHFHHPDGRRARLNSGAPIVLVAYGAQDADQLCGSELSGWFVPLRLPRAFQVAMLAAESWVSAVVSWMQGRNAPVSLSELYEAFESHPKTAGRAHWRPKLRQTLQRGPFRPLGDGRWELAT